MAPRGPVTLGCGPTPERVASWTSRWPVRLGNVHFPAGPVAEPWTQEERPIFGGKPSKLGLR